MTILDRIANDSLIGFVVSGRPFPETPRPYWNGARRLVHRDQDKAFAYCQRLNDQSHQVFSVLATEIRDDDDLVD